MHRFLLTLHLIGCAPPPLVEVAVEDTGSTPPAILIVHPEPETQIQLRDDCLLDTIVAVDIDNFELTPPDPTNVETGKGHWHLILRDDGSYTPVSAQSAKIAAPGFAPNTIVRIRATLQASDHSDLDMFPNWEDFVEVTILDNDAGSCGASGT